MATAFNFDTNHADLVHDMAYDYYGQRLVTVSSDQQIKLWDFVEKGEETRAGSWTLRESWKGHDAPALKISWAHPEFGSLFATCSFDKTVKIWEEVLTVNVSTSVPHTFQVEGAAQERAPKVQTGNRWVERARINDFRSPVQDIQFAPHHQGLKLATISSDGIVRIYEATTPSNTSSWTLVDEFDALEESLSSSPSLVSSNLFAANGSLASPAAAPSKGNSAGAPSRLHPLATNLQSATGMMMDALFCLSWCDHRLLPPALAVGCGLLNCVKIYRMGHHNRWQAIESISHADVVTAVAWAPCMGRSFHLIATSSKDGHVCIFKFVDDLALSTLLTSPVNSISKQQPLSYASAVSSAAASQGSSQRNKHSIQKVADFPDHHSEVWRVVWNITGTILTSSGDDGKVRIWGSTYSGEWKCMSVLSSDQGKVPPTASDTLVASSNLDTFTTDPGLPKMKLAKVNEAWAHAQDSPAPAVPTFF